MALAYAECQIAMRLPVRQQESVFRSDWQHIEERLQEQREVGRIGELTAFIRHYLAMHSFILSNEEHVYARFRDRMERECPTVDAFITEIATLRRFAGYYDRFLRPEHEPRPAVRQRLTRLGILETSTSYPFLMRLFDAADAGSLSECDLVSALDIIENYFVRRYLIGETQYVNRMFPTLCRDIQHYDATLPATLRALLATKRCPTDDEVRAAARKRPLYVQSRTYSSIRLRALLTRINEHLSRDCDAVTVLQGTPTIEHILPQTLTDAWRRDLGDAAEQILHDYGDTLGNLTLVTQCYNSQLSNRSFAEKARELAHHGLKLNDVYFADPPALWNAVAIQQRADFLVDQILAIWPSLGSDYMKRAEWQTGAKPKLLIIRDEVIPVKLWCDIIYQTAEYCIRQGAFEAVAQAVPKLVSAEKIDGKYPKDWTVLSNHWSVKVNMSREQVKSVCRRIFSAIGVSENEWHIEEESVESTSGM